jgi:LacI family transcriptional regulator
MRLEGYKRALKKAGIPFREELVSEVSRGDVGSKAQGANEAARMLRRRTRPDGLFCFSDPMAMGALDAALDAGISIPKQLAVIGCGNFHYDGSLRIPLSSVDQDNVGIGQRVAEIIFAQALDDKPTGNHVNTVKKEYVVLNPRLVIRQSTIR